MQRRRLWFLRGIALLMSGAVAFAGAEVAVRVWQTGKRAAAKVEVKPDANGCFPGYDTPGWNYESQENFPPMVFDAVTCYRPNPGHASNGVKINPQGFRHSADLNEPTPTNTFRVFILGGSFAYGAGCPDEATYFRVAEQLLQESDPARRFEVICAAAGAFSSLQEHATLISRVARYRPNLVVFMTGANDAYFSTKGQSVLDGNDYLAYDAAIRGCIDGEILPRYYYGQVFRDPRAPFPPLYEDYACKTRWLVDKVAYNAAQRGTKATTVPMTAPDRTADDFLYIQALNQAWGKSQKVPTLVLLQPTISTTAKPRHPAELKIASDHTAEFHQQLQAVYRAIRERLESQHEITWMDLDHGVSGLTAEDCFFVDWVHAGETGQRFVGEMLADVIANHLLPGKPLSRWRRNALIQEMNIPQEPSDRRE